MKGVQEQSSENMGAGRNGGNLGCNTARDLVACTGHQVLKFRWVGHVACLVGDKCVQNFGAEKSHGIGRFEHKN
jgi:hypothetical protein